MVNKNHKKHQKLILTLVPVLVIAIVLTIAACAPGTRILELLTGSEGVQPFEWTPTTDCGACHQTEVASEKDVTSLCGFMLSEGADVTCMDCHNDEPALKIVHKGKSSLDQTPSRLTASQIGSEFCLECHDQKEIMSATAGSAVLTDFQSTVVNPHDIPLVSSKEQKAILDHQIIVCADCHKMHVGIAERDENAMKVCTGCHHEHVFECNTCHAA